jgi:hypothetical protein
LKLFIMATFMVCSSQCPTMGTSGSSCMIFMRNFPYLHINLGLFTLNGNPSFKLMPFTFFHFHNFLKYLCAKGFYTYASFLFHLKLLSPWKMAFNAWILVMIFPLEIPLSYLAHCFDLVCK